MAVVVRAEAVSDVTLILNANDTQYHLLCKSDDSSSNSIRVNLLS